MSYLTNAHKNFDTHLVAVGLLCLRGNGVVVGRGLGRIVVVNDAGALLGSRGEGVVVLSNLFSVVPSRVSSLEMVDGGSSPSNSSKLSLVSPMLSFGFLVACSTLLAVILAVLLSPERGLSVGSRKPKSDTVVISMLGEIVVVSPAPTGAESGSPLVLGGIFRGAPGCCWWRWRWWATPPREEWKGTTVVRGGSVGLGVAGATVVVRMKAGSLVGEAGRCGRRVSGVRFTESCLEPLGSGV